MNLHPCVLASITTQHHTTPEANSPLINTMSSVDLKSWVTQQYKEVGFGENRRGSFIGKKALKEHMIRRYPQHKDKIRQLVNAYVTDLEPL